ncbi:MAG: hypothetical protein AB7E70_09590 [Hyphomicrobiaceae bacterium]
MTTSNYEFRFERRRYGRTTFTWVYVRHPETGEWLSLGDPYQGVRPPAAELDALADTFIELHDNNA